MLRATFFKLGTRTKAPRDTDRNESAVGCRLHIDAGIAHVERLLRRATGDLQHVSDYGRIGLCGYALALPKDSRETNVWEVLSD